MASFRKRILLTYFTQPQAGSRRTAQLAVFLQHEVRSPEPSRGSSEGGGQLPWPVLLRWRVWSSKNRRGFFGRGPLDLAEMNILHRLPEGKPQVPDPLTRDLPEFLPALGGGTPAIGIFF